MPIVASVLPEGVLIQEYPEWPGWTFLVRLSHETPGEPTVVGIDLYTPGPHEPLDAKKFREVPFGALRRIAIGEFFDPFVSLLAAEVRSGKRPRGGNVSHSEQVVIVYRAALDQGFAPRSAIARHFETSEKTASRWLSEARRRKLLGSYENELAASNERMEWPAARRERLIKSPDTWLADRGKRLTK